MRQHRREEKHLQWLHRQSDWNQWNVIVMAARRVSLARAWLNLLTSLHARAWLNSDRPLRGGLLFLALMRRGMCPPCQHGMNVEKRPCCFVTLFPNCACVRYTVLEPFYSLSHNPCPEKNLWKISFSHYWRTPWVFKSCWAGFEREMWEWYAGGSSPVGSPPPVRRVIIFFFIRTIIKECGEERKPSKTRFSFYLLSQEEIYGNIKSGFTCHALSHISHPWLGRGLGANGCVLSRFLFFSVSSGYNLEGTEVLFFV